MTASAATGQRGVQNLQDLSEIVIFISFEEQRSCEPTNSSDL